jgi:hypothetical protein
MRPFHAFWAGQNRLWRVKADEGWSLEGLWKE